MLKAIGMLAEVHTSTCSISANVIIHGRIRFSPGCDCGAGCLRAQGLPTDDLSVQNGILVTRATRFPILVDPQGQGRAWLRQREAAAQLRTIGLADKAFRAALEVLPRACMQRSRHLGVY